MVCLKPEVDSLLSLVKDATLNLLHLLAPPINSEQNCGLCRWQRLIN